MSSSSPEGARAGVNTTSTSGDTFDSSQSNHADQPPAAHNGAAPAWRPREAEAEAAARGSDTSEGSALASVTAEMRNMARAAAGKAQSAAATAAQAARRPSPTTRTETRPSDTKTETSRVRSKGPRRVRLAVARVDPWSIMKMSFLLSVAVGIAGVVLTALLWMILSTMNVFSDVEGVLQSLQTTTSNPFSIKDYVGFGRVVSLSIVIGVIDVILMTAIATVMAFLYNIASALVGGVQLTLTDD